MGDLYNILSSKVTSIYELAKRLGNSELMLEISNLQMELAKSQSEYAKLLVENTELKAENTRLKDGNKGGGISFANVVRA